MKSEFRSQARKEGIGLYRYNVSYQAISDFKIEGDELVFKISVAEGVYAITRELPIQNRIRRQSLLMK